jgi:hypothetical protein
MKLNAPLKTKRPTITIQRMRKLRPGETMIVYRGDFELDLSHKGARKYQALLQRVHDVMRQLEREGRTVVRVEKVVIGTPSAKEIVSVNQYLAVGTDLGGNHGRTTVD